MRIAAVGAGRMGRGIAQVMAYAGLPCDLIDLKPRDEAAASALEAAARDEIAASLAVLVDAGVLDATDVAPILDRIRFHPEADADRALAGADVVFEGVPEVLDLKRAALARVERCVRPEAIIASTTSTISAEDLARGLATPGRYLNAHWLNPAYLVPLVEVSPSSHTTRAVTDRLKDLLRRVGKVAVECKPAPGYIVPRIQVVAMNEAARIVESGVATASDVDDAIRTGFGVRYALLGLLEFIDYGGVEILHHASRYMHESTGDSRYEAPPVIGRMMEAGERGLREGKGFHDYGEVDVEAYRRETIARFVDLVNHLGLLPRPGGAG